MAPLIYLYVKTHNTTGLKYFGKTYYTDPHKYKGSGVYWKNHIKKHGYDVTTEIIGSFEDEEQAMIAALQFSKENDIVNSPLWANLIFENGKDGAPKGHKSYIEWNEKRRQTVSKRSKEKWADPLYKEKLRQAQKDRWQKYLDSQLPARQKELLAQREYKRRRAQGLPALHQKPEGFGARVSASTKGRPKSDAHKKALSEARKGTFVKLQVVAPVSDHLGNIFESPRRFAQAYGLNGDTFFFKNLNTPLRYKSFFEKFGIPYTEENKKKTKKEFGFRFINPKKAKIEGL